MSIMKPREMAKKFGVTVKTLQRWDASGKLVAYRTPTNRRYYTEDQYLAITKQKPISNRKKHLDNGTELPHSKKTNL